MKTNPRRWIIGIMGGGSVSRKSYEDAYRLGSLLAQRGWIVLNGGRNCGVMEASARGARDHGGVTIGILPDRDLSRASEYIDIPIVTGMGDARNCINVLSSDIVVACPGGAGTLSEIALAIKSGKTVILLEAGETTPLSAFLKPGEFFIAETPEAVVDRIESIIGEKAPPAV